MQYALLAYGQQDTRDAARPVESAIAAVLARAGGAIEVRPVFEAQFRGA